MKTYKCKVCDSEAVFKYSKQNIYCSITCQQKQKRSELVEDWLAGGSKSKWKYAIPAWVKSYIIELRGYYCEECRIHEHNNKPLTLQIDHKDGNSSNNDVTNLRLLCPNCHSQTHTYGGKNIGTGGREHRKKYLKSKVYGN